MKFSTAKMDMSDLAKHISKPLPLPYLLASLTWRVAQMEFTEVTKYKFLWERIHYKWSNEYTVHQSVSYFWVMLYIPLILENSFILYMGYIPFILHLQIDLNFSYF